MSLAFLATLILLASCSGSQVEEVGSGDDDQAIITPQPDPIPQPPPPIRGQQASSCVVRPSNVSCLEEERCAIVGATELLCNSTITGPKLSASKNGTRHVAFRLGDSGGFQPAEVGLWTAHEQEPDRIQILHFLGGFPAVASDEQGVAHLVRIEQESAVYYHCAEADPSRWSRELVARLTRDAYPTDIAVALDGQPRLVIRRRGGGVALHRRKMTGHWWGRDFPRQDPAGITKLEIDENGEEHVVHWVRGAFLVLRQGGVRRTTREPGPNGDGLAIGTIKTAGMSRPRTVIAYRGSISHHSNGVHVLTPLGENEHLDVLLSYPEGLPESDCPSNHRQNQALRCQRNIMSLGLPSIALWTDSTIWVSYVAYVSIQQMELRPGVQDRVLSSRSLARLTLARISPVGGSSEIRMVMDLPNGEGSFVWDPLIEKVGDELHLVYRSSERSLTLLRIDPSRTTVIETGTTEPTRYELFR